MSRAFFGRSRLGSWFVLCAALAWVGPVGMAREIDRPPEPLRTRVELERGPHYAGQAIRARLIVMASEEAPILEPPEAAQAELVEVKRGIRPIVATGIGDQVEETNAYVWDYLIVPRQTGRVVIPPFRVRLGERQGLTRILELEARQPPGAGRPPGFLGGIGEVEVSSRLIPDSLRVGEVGRLEIRLKGPGAFGSIARPEIVGVSRGVPGVKVELVGRQWNPGQAERIWTYEIRPTEPGEGRIPPVLVSTFDPRRGRYVSASTAAIRFRVAALPAFRPDAIERPISPDRQEKGDAVAKVIAVLAGVGVGLALAGLGWIRAGDQACARIYARRVIRELRQARAEETPSLAARGLAGVLARTGVWLGGELTPEEAGRAVERATGQARLAEEAFRLVERIDVHRFGSRAGEAESLREAAACLIREISRRGLLSAFRDRPHRRLSLVRAASGRFSRSIGP